MKERSDNFFPLHPEDYDKKNIIIVAVTYFKEV